MKNRIKAAVAGAVILVIVTASAAFSFPSHYMSGHGPFTWDGYDYRHVQRFERTTSGCYGHLDLYERRPVMQPWAAWKGYTQDHCVQV